MSKARITFTLTEQEVEALVQLAECSANTWEDAANVLDDPDLRLRGRRVAAGYRAIEKLNTVLYAAKGTLRREPI